MVQIYLRYYIIKSKWNTVALSNGHNKLVSSFKYKKKKANL